MTEDNNPESSNNKSFLSEGLFNYTSKGKQSVIRFFGIELTAPSGLKNPGIVYLSFIFINLLLFIILKSFVTG